MLITPHFRKQEFTCRCGCGYDDIDPSLVMKLEEFRNFVGIPVRVNSGCRCPSHNKAVNGRPHSYHLSGRACDISIFGNSNYGLEQIRSKLVELFPGVIEYSTFFHVDVRQVPFQQLRGPLA